MVPIAIALQRQALQHKLPARLWLVMSLSQFQSVGVLVVGKPQHSVEDLVRFFRTDIVWTVGAGENLVRIAGEAMTGGRARRSWVWRSAISIAADIAAAIAGNPPDSDHDAVEHSAGGIA